MIGGTGYGEQLSWQAAQDKCHSYGKLYGLASIQTRFEQGKAFAVKNNHILSTSLSLLSSWWLAVAATAVAATAVAAATAAAAAVVVVALGKCLMAILLFFYTFIRVSLPLVELISPRTYSL